VIGWDSTTEDAWWTVNISTDHGATWAETYEWYTTTGLSDVDGAVVGDWFYVGYVSGPDSSEVRVRRFRITDGSTDYGYGYQTVLDAGTSYFREIAVVSNADDFDNRIYFIAQRHYFDLRFAWATDAGSGFTELEVPETVSVAGGLAATWAYQYDCTDFIFISYAGTDHGIHVLRRSPDDWTDTILEANVSSNSETSVSVFGTNVICAYEVPMTYGKGIAYRISYDCGSGWATGNVATPGGPDLVYYVNPSVDARNGQGTAVVYQKHATDGDSAFYRCRAGFAPGAWSTAAVFSDHDVFSGLDMGFSPLSAGDDPFDLGVIYIGYANRIPYFDQPGLAASSVPDRPASTAALRLLPPSPNPFRRQTMIRFELPAPARARLELFDLLGRRVATLLDEDLGPGPREVPLEGRGLASGFYTYRLSAGTETGSGKLIMIP